MEANSIDFVIHAVNGEVPEADMDAATLAAQLVTPSTWRTILTRGYAESDAVMAWGFLTWLEDRTQ